MSFVVKQITQRAAGGTIERIKRFDTVSLLVGRAVDADIQLGDLAVQLQHVRLRDVGGGRVEIEPIDGAAVQIDRKLVGTMQLSLARAPVIIVGGEKLELGPGENDGEIAVKVERLDAPAQTRDERAVFTLARALPTRRIMAWGLAAAVLVLFLAWPILAPHRATVATAAPGIMAAQPAAFHPDQTWDAGPLSPPHAFLSKNCAACHTKAFVSVTDTTCLSCHAGKQPGKPALAVLRDHADPKRLVASHGTIPGFEAKLRAAVGPSFGLKEWSCTGCHKEHVGADTTPVSSDAFCAGCHNGLKSRLPDTKIADVASWDSHPQFRPAITDNSGATPKLTRVVLDGRQQEDTGLKFPHALHLSGTNAVAQMTRRLSARYDGEKQLGCADCHHTDPTGVRFVQPTMERDCASCHTLAFATQNGTVRTLRHGEPAQVIAELRDYLRGGGGGAASPPSDRARVGLVAFRPAAGGSADARIRAVFEKGGACFDCHVITPTGPLAYAVKPVTFTSRYLTKGWFSHADHATAASPCSSCHAVATTNSSTALLLPGVKSCQTCHAVKPAANQVASPCASCHSYHNGDGAPAFVRSEAAKSGGLTTKTAASTIDKPASKKPDNRGNESAAAAG